MLRSLCVSSATLVAVAVAVLGAGLLLVPVATFPEEEVGELVRAYYHSSDRSYVDPSCLLCGKTVVVTGSTSGLGESIARRLYKVSLNLNGSALAVHALVDRLPATKYIRWVLL